MVQFASYFSSYKWPYCVLNVISRCKFGKNGVFDTIYPLSHRDKGVTGGYKERQGVTRGNRGLQGVTWGDRGLQRVTGGDRGLQKG